MASITMLIVIFTIVLQSTEGSLNGKNEHIEPGLMQERRGNGCTLKAYIKKLYFVNEFIVNYFHNSFILFNFSGCSQWKSSS